MLFSDGCVSFTGRRLAGWTLTSRTFADKDMGTCSLNRGNRLVLYIYIDSGIVDLVIRTCQELWNTFD